MGIEAIYQRPNTSQRHPDHKVYPYLLRGLAIDRPNQVWCADITYIPMAKGFVYLVAVMDWFSRRVLAGVCRSAWRQSSVEALQDAMDRHGQPGIFNTDQGVQFTSAAFIDELTNRGVRMGMDGKGRFLDNIFIERSLAQSEIRGGVHQGSPAGCRGTLRHRHMARLLQRRASAPGLGLSDAARNFRRRSGLWICGQRSRFAALRSRVDHIPTGPTTATNGAWQSIRRRCYVACAPRYGWGLW